LSVGFGEDNGALKREAESSTEPSVVGLPTNRSVYIPLLVEFSSFPDREDDYRSSNPNKSASWSRVPRIWPRREEYRIFGR
jgi:hypothetical protein